MSSDEQYSGFNLRILGKGVNVLLPREFPAKACEADGKSLEGRQRLTIVHGEHVLPYLPELEKNLFVPLLVSRGPDWGNQLKVLCRTHGGPTVEIQGEALLVLIPNRGFVCQDCVPVRGGSRSQLQFLHLGIETKGPFFPRDRRRPSSIWGRMALLEGTDYPPWTSRFPQIDLVGHMCSTAGWLSIIDCEVDPEYIWSATHFEKQIHVTKIFCLESRSSYCSSNIHNIFQQSLSDCSSSESVEVCVHTSKHFSDKWKPGFVRVQLLIWPVLGGKNNEDIIIKHWGYPNLVLVVQKEQAPTYFLGVLAGSF